MADALAVVLVLRADEPARFERAIVRWHALAFQEARGLGAREAQLMLAALQALQALQALRGPAAAPAGRLLAELCALYELAGAAEVLDGWLERAGPAGYA